MMDELVFFTLVIKKSTAYTHFYPWESIKNLKNGEENAKKNYVLVASIFKKL